MDELLCVLPKIIKRLETWQDLHEGRTDHLDKLIYLSALFRDQSFVGILNEMLQDPSPGFYYDCIYDCPIIFACILYGYLEGWSPPKHLAYNFEMISNIWSGIFKIDMLPLEQRKTEDMGPGIDSYTKEALKNSREELIKRAGPSNPNYRERAAAAFVLESSIVDSKNLNDLYWLAINSEEKDFEYRNCIYQAIYKAEKARREGK